MTDPVVRAFTFGMDLWSGRAGLFLRFVAASALYVVVSALLRRVPPAGRAWGQVAASVALIAALTSPVIAGLMAAYALGLYWLAEDAPLGRARLAVLVPYLALQVLAPILWFPALPGYESRVREFVAFATNMTLLRAWAYVYDRHAGRTPERPALRDYALYTFFFPGFVNGPLLSLDEFRRALVPAYWSPVPGAGGLALAPFVRVATGSLALALALVFVPAHALGPEQYAAAASDGALASWRQSLLVYFGVYLGFTAWTEVSLGFACLAGVVLPENFDAPLRSYGIADFWRRWNIRLGWWMRNYIYLPLGGAHPRGWQGRTAWMNVAAVFAATALYHHLGGIKLLGTGLLAFPAFYAGWALWALYNTVGTLATRTWRPPPRWGVRDVLIVALTFVFHCVALLTAFFPANLPLERLAAIYRHLLFF